MWIRFPRKKPNFRDCWTWDSENEVCVLSDECPTFLKCSPQMMDFRFNFDKYFGASTKDLNVQAACPIQVNDRE